METINSKICKGLFCLFFCLMAFSCSSRLGVKKNIEQMMEKPINTIEENMVRWLPRSTLYKEDGKAKRFSFVVYVDSSQCTPCFINGLKEWNELLDLEKSKKYNIRFLFIIESRIGESTLLCRRLNDSQFTHAVLIDKQYLFRKANPQIPKETMYHTFLLDKNSNVVLVGNPLHNEDVKKLFYRILDKNEVYEKKHSARKKAIVHSKDSFCSNVLTIAIFPVVNSALLCYRLLLDTNVFYDTDFIPWR